MSDDNEATQVALVGGVIGSYFGLGYTFYTGALQTFWAATPALSLTITPIPVALAVAVPTLGTVGIGAAIAYGSYQIYGLFACAQQRQEPPEAAQQSQNSFQ